MPRGRKGLWLIHPLDFKKAMRYFSTLYAAEQFGVSQRTVRRWLQTGLPLGYGRNPISEETWLAFASTGRTALKRSGKKRTGVDRQLSARGLGQVSAGARSK
jgi:hypothetical protein